MAKPANKPPAKIGLLLRLYMSLGPFLAPLAVWVLKRRLKKGKEDPARWREKLGQTTHPRPHGKLIWLHAVGVGEALALPGFIEKLKKDTRIADTQTHFLITTTSRNGAIAVERNMPADCVHQYLPLDSTKFIERFLDHWKPDLSIWAERDVWPSLIIQTARRAIPLSIINARMDAASFAKKNRLRGLFKDVYNHFDLIDAQDPTTVNHLKQLGVNPDLLSQSGSLKSSNVVLRDFPEKRKAWEHKLAGNDLWMAASTHPADEPTLIDAHKELLKHNPCAKLIIAPRDVKRADDICETLSKAGLTVAKIIDATPPSASADVFVETAIGQMGLWYRLAKVVFIGGSLGNIGGHNPYEALMLKTIVLHGPDVENFAHDYALLTQQGFVKEYCDPIAIGNAVSASFNTEPPRTTPDAANTEAIDNLATRVAGLMFAP